ncbi:BlaI family penicillinase repressor [Sporomusaceae bacterium BoRhaA]|uniref:BlaI/MecI/CopY family transcriptional regulator n=1 Tax=Pelorhabdus rhamnosifermentans TaxID=2772457 RepID=UPI001C0615BE|nr:BlaI/MecI/CopY family transcriptional regulator [Pelorhabdus rhamnosifermentans]MBU2703080.1 BlaI family penicillinase repressor [Pelorhabdus rhamnosifermentans]
MKKLPQISDTEWQVMKILWSSAPITANEVIKKFDGVMSWKPKTIKTLLGRLVKKQAIAFNKDGRTYVYYPLVAEDECVKAESQSFLEKVFSGALNVMFANFLEEKELSREEIEELKRILDQKKK